MVRGCGTVTVPRKGCGGGGGGGGGGGAKPSGGGAWRVPSRRRRRCLALTMALLGALIALISGALALCAPLLFQSILSSELTIRPGSTSFNLWKETPVPISLEFYFFNWTNPEELRDPGSRPALVEMGPYVFKEEHEKQDIVWNANATVSFRQARRWYFDAEASNGSLDDTVTTLDVIPLTAAFHVRRWSYLMRFGLSASLKTLGQRLDHTRRVGELLFEGHDSPLIAMAGGLSGLSDLKIPYDRFGWFYQRNGSNEYDGLFTMHTGADDLSLLGRLSRWNGASRTSFFPGPCGLVNGSAGELWPPARSRHTPIAMFSPDLCRSIELPFSEEATVHGVRGLRFAGGRRLLSNATEHGPNECFCGGECTPSGVLNVSTCRFGAPAFVSFPHFLHADEYYLQAVEGLRPDADRHTFFITLEPETGIPLDVAARFQINILLQQYDGITLFKDVPRVFFPMVWFEERAAITPDMARDLRLLLWMRSGMRTVALLVAAVGIAVAIVAVVVLAYWRCTTPPRWDQCRSGSALDGAAMPLHVAGGRDRAMMAPTSESETPLQAHQRIS